MLNVITRGQALSRSLGRGLTTYTYKRKIRRVLDQLAAAGTSGDNTWPGELTAPALSLLGGVAPGYRDLRWHKAYTAINRWPAAGYIPEDIFYCAIEPGLNPPDRANLYRDKNLYDRMGFPNLPATVARVIRGRLLDAAYRPVTVDALALDPAREYVIKPSAETGGGKGVRFLQGAGVAAALTTPATPATLAHERHATPGPRAADSRAADLIVQPVLGQAEELSRLNASSINTYRIVTLRLNGRIIHLSSVLRIGRSSARVDNQASGGMACGVNDGRLRGFAVDKAFRRLAAHPDSGVRFKGLALPAYRQAEALCHASHLLLPDIDMVSWDIAVTAEHVPVLIEFNLRGQEINFHQLCNGPLFGQCTGDVLDRARGRCRLGLLW